MRAKLILHETREKSLLRRHPWIFSKAVRETIDPPENGGDIGVYAAGGSFLATASYSPNSQIRARVWTFAADARIDRAFFAARIRAAAALRGPLIAGTGATAYRLVNAEADGLPGLIVDRYGDWLALAALSAGAEFHLPEITDALAELYPDCGIYERSDSEARRREGLEPRTGPIRGGMPPDEIVIEENGGVKMIADVVRGQKTGCYLDQRANRAALARYCRGKAVLNCFSYTGGFALYALKGGAKSVVNVDVSKKALETAKRNVVINHLDPGRVRFVCADVFAFLREERKAGRVYDVIVLDPPKFAESRSQLEKACRGYKDVAMCAAALLSPGGYLFTFSCSGHMTPELFRKVTADAFLDAGREGRIAEFFTQAEDHPVSLACPETLYLKGLAVRAVGPGPA